MSHGIKKFFRGISYPFVAASLGLRLSSAKGKYRRYKADPTSISIEKRYAYVYGLVKRATYLHGCEIYASGFNNCPTVPALYIVNHKSYLDGLLIFKLMWENGNIPYFRIIAKAELDEGKLSSVMHLIDSILINRKNIRDTATLFRDEIKPTLDKKSFVIFPEGTRIYNNEELGEFKPGSFKIALDHFIPIVPVVIYGSSGVGFKEPKQYLNKNRQIFVSFLPPIKATHFMTAHATSVAEHVKAVMTQEYTRIHNIVKSQKKQYVKNPHRVFEEIDNEKKTEKRK